MNGLIAPGDFEHALAHLHFTTPEQVPQRPDPPPFKSPLSTSPPASLPTASRHTAKRSLEIKPISISLPPEILLCVGHALFDPWLPSIPSWTVLSSEPVDHLAEAERRLCLGTLRSLSSTCVVARALMTPMLWHTVRLTHPAQLGPLRTLMKWYQRSSFSLSPTPTPTLTASDLPQPHSVLSERPSFPFPLPLVRRLEVCIPEAYPSFNDEALCDLLRSGMASGLKELCWDAEKTPTASVLAILATHSRCSRKTRLGTTEQEGDRSFDRIERERLAMRGAMADKMESEIGRAPWMGGGGGARSSSSGGVGSESNESVVRWARDSEAGEGFPGVGQALGPSNGIGGDGAESDLDDHDDDADDSDDEDDGKGEGGLVSLSVNCKMFWPGHPNLTRLIQLRHLQLTKYDTFLMPPQLPALLRSLRRPLLSLSMSTSKISLLHTLPLLRSGAFRKLRYLDVYPVTPEEPLPSALRSAATELRHLRLILDINGGFSNYDDLWKKLKLGRLGSGGGQRHRQRQTDSLEASSSPYPLDPDEVQSGMPNLETLDVDPYPSQHTAPAFEDFVRSSAPRLRRINGREASALLETQGALLNPIDPDHITSALAY